MSNLYTPEYLAENISASLLATSISFLVIETTFVVLMYASRYFAKDEPTNKWMDVFITSGFIVCVGKITIAILLVEIGGTGRHLVALSPETLRNALKLSTVLQIVCPLTTSLSKLGVLCFLYRIFARLGRWYRIVIYATFGFVLAIMIVQVLIPFLNCRPFSQNWNPQGPGSCAISGLLLWRYLGIPNVFTTLVIVAVPVPALAKLHVSRNTKSGLAAVLLVCVAGIVAAVMRFQSFLEVTDFHDITYQNVKPLCWTIAESGIYLLAGIMLTLKPLVRRIFKDTAFERWIKPDSKASGSWNTRMLIRRWHQRASQPAYAVSKEQRSSSDVTLGDVSLAREPRNALSV